jgi:prolipoprotein diacylglyceryltransferase
MSRTVLAGLAFAGGVVAGLLAAKWYAKRTIATDIAKGASALGFSGETAGKIGDLLAPQLVD